MIQTRKINNDITSLLLLTFVMTEECNRRSSSTLNVKLEKINNWTFQLHFNYSTFNPAVIYLSTVTIGKIRAMYEMLCFGGFSF